MSKVAPEGIKNGDWYAFCDVCERRFFGSTLSERWDGFTVCSDDLEERHPQDFIKTVKEYRKPPVARPKKLGTNEDSTPNSDVTTGNSSNWYGNGSIS